MEETIYLVEEDDDDDGGEEEVVKVCTTPPFPPGFAAVFFGWGTDGRVWADFLGVYRVDG